MTNDTTTGGTNKNDEKAGGAGADGLKAGGADVAQVQLGLRPSYLVDDMSKSDLKIKLKSCEKGPFKRTDFAISHRGAPLQFPEHTKERQRDL